MLLNVVVFCLGLSVTFIGSLGIIVSKIRQKYGSKEKESSK